MEAQTPIAPPAPSPAASPTPDIEKSRWEADDLERSRKIMERAAKGDTSVLPELRQRMEHHAAYWRRRYSLVMLCEQGWINEITKTDLVLAMSLRLQAEEMNRNLAGPTPSSLEQVLTDRIVASWLGMQYAELSVASGQDSGVRVVEMRTKQLDSAHRRFLAAVKALATVRRLQRGLTIEIRHQGDGQEATATPAAEQNQATLPTRLKGMFAEADRIEKEAIAAV